MVYTYTGDPQYQPPLEGIRDPDGREYHPYLPDPTLAKAINLAIALQRPLLLEGEPGCGKTRVAGALAYELAQKNLHPSKPGPEDKKNWWPFYIWNITSTSRARDGLYTFDAVGRLRDAQLIGSDPERLKKYLGKKETEALESRLSDTKQYRKFGALGNAFQQERYRPVMLIDEIDKADSDFPNDLLLELDELRFTIPETDETIPPPGNEPIKPIILITSNREKPLSEAFLRRCLYYYVTFPEEKLRDILTARFGSVVTEKKAIVERALQEFSNVRDFLGKQPGSRPPGTSELLEFFTALCQDGKPIEEALAELNNLAQELPLLGTLIKTKADQELYQRRSKAP